jgi:hypothetical protein
LLAAKALQLCPMWLSHASKRHWLIGHALHGFGFAAAC